MTVYNDSIPAFAYGPGRLDRLAAGIGLALLRWSSRRVDLDHDEHLLRMQVASGIRDRELAALRLAHLH